MGVTTPQYVREHPLALVFSLSMALTGILVLAIPSVRETSPTVYALPIWTAGIWGAGLLLGGSMATFGLLRDRPDYESAGMALLSSGQLVALVTTLSAFGFTAAVLSTVLRGGLAIGCGARAWHLARVGPSR
jgi:hypothetical protein